MQSIVGVRVEYVQIPFERKQSFLCQHGHACAVYGGESAAGDSFEKHTRQLFKADDLYRIEAVRVCVIYYSSFCVEAHLCGYDNVCVI